MVSTSNKQLNFVQHLMTILKPGGRAAIVLPDNCLFEEQAGEVFDYLTQDCNLHTILRLPRGTFTPYSAGVKANVIFFAKGHPTENVWIYDARSNVPGITKKDRPLSPLHFAEFETCYGDDPSAFSVKALEHRALMAQKCERFRKFHISEVKERNFNLDIFWLKDEALDDAENLPEVEDLASDALTYLEAAADEVQEILRFLGNGVKA